MNKKGKMFLTLVAIVIVILIAAKLSKSSNPTNSSPVRIGGAFLLTGAAAKVGELQNNGAQMAFDAVNKDNGVNGRPVELVIEDAGYTPATAVSAYQALKFKGLHLFLIDGSPVVAATHNLVIADGNFTIAGAATAPSYFDNNDLTCRIALTARNFGPAMADRLWSQGRKSAALLLPDNEYGKGVSEEFSKAFEAKGGKVVISEFYDAAAGTTDFRTILSKLKNVQNSYDALVLSNPISSLVPMLGQMKEFGLNKPIITDNPTIDNPTLPDFSPLEGAEIINYGYLKTDLPTDSAETKAFKDEYRSRYHSDPSYFAAAAYDTTWLLVKAIRAVGEDPKKIGDYISNLKGYAGVTGTFSFNNDCEVDRERVIQTIKNGQIQVVTQN